MILNIFIAQYTIIARGAIKLGASFLCSIILQMPHLPELCYIMLPSIDGIAYDLDINMLVLISSWLGIYS